MSDALRYGAGLPLAGTRRLSEEERRTVERRLGRLTVQIGLETAVVGIAVTAGIALSRFLNPSIVDSVGGTWGSAACATGTLGAFVALVAGRKLWRLGSAAGVVYLLVVASLGTLAPETRLPSEWLTWSVVLTTVLLGNSYLASRLYRQARLIRRTRAISADLEEGEVEQYAGRTNMRFVDAAFRRLAADGWLHEGSGHDAHRLELLPRSGLVLRIDGRVLPRLEVAHVADIAPALPHALRVDLPDGVAPTSAPPRLDLKRRSLTPAEREELTRHIRRLRGRYWPVIAVTVATVAIVASRLWPTFDPAALLDTPVLLWYGLSIFAYGAYVRRVLAARKLEYDRKLRWVVTVDDLRSDAAAPAPPKLEVLPMSQLAWTENATPAGWRVSKL